MLEASAQGFKTVKLDRIEVNAAQTLNLPLRLEIGSPTEEVVVSAANEVVVQSADGARVNTLGEREIRLPVLDSTPVNLVFTLPGAADVTFKRSRGGFVQGTEFSINGLRPRGNNQLIDGLDNNDNSITGQVYQPTVRDAYSQVTVLGGDYSAGSDARAAQSSTSSRAVARTSHGSVYDIIQNSAFDVLTPGQKSAVGTDGSAAVQSKHSGLTGGPVIQNKLFFFGTFQVISCAQVGSRVSRWFRQQRAESIAHCFRCASPNLDRYLEIVGDLRTDEPDQRSAPGGRPEIEFGTATRFSAQPVDTGLSRACRLERV